MGPSAGRRALGKAQAGQRGAQARGSAERYSQAAADESVCTKAVQGKQAEQSAVQLQPQQDYARRLRAGAERGDSDAQSAEPVC